MTTNSAAPVKPGKPMVGRILAVIGLGLALCLAGLAALFILMTPGNPVYQAGYQVLTGHPPAPSEPYDQWFPSSSTPGGQLLLTELRREKGQASTTIVYQVAAPGAALDQSYTLWAFSNGSLQPSMIGRYKVIQAGRLVSLSSNTPLEEFRSDLYSRGSALGVALISDDQKVRLFTRVTPFPIETSDSNGCHVWVELATRSGTSFMIWGEGFEPKELIKGTSLSEGEFMNLNLVADEHGRFETALFPAVKGKANGVDALTFKSQRCQLKLEYEWGPPALVFR